MEYGRNWNIEDVGTMGEMESKADGRLRGEVISAAYRDTAENTAVSTRETQLSLYVNIDYV